MIETEIKRDETEVEWKRGSLEKSRSWNHVGKLGKSAGFMTKVVLGRLTVNQELKLGWGGKNILTFTSIILGPEC